MKINKNGFSLVELLAVIAIILLFGMLVIPNIDNIFNRHNDKKTKIIEESIIDATSTYCDFNDCDTNIYITTLIDERLLDKDELNEFYSNINECYVEKTNDEYIIKNCNLK